jgi:hypothetical protein
MSTRTRVRRRSLFGVLLLAVLSGVVLVRLAGDDPTGEARPGVGGGDARLERAAQSFSIAGDSTQPISPGVSWPLDLEFTNPTDGPVWVSELRVTVRKVSAPNADESHPCVVRDFAVDQATAGLEITLDARATDSLSGLGLANATWPHIGMRDRAVNQDGCKGASLTLGYAASATSVT